MLWLYLMIKNELFIIIQDGQDPHMTIVFLGTKSYSMQVAKISVVMNIFWVIQHIQLAL